MGRLTLEYVKNVEFATACNACESCTHSNGMTPINWKNKKISTIPQRIIELVNGESTCVPYSYPSRLSEVTSAVDWAKPNAPKLVFDAERK